ncbi:CRISPR-associated endonuclease Cas1 [Candidatus Micrarchaeota archaeon]|nr:MAG: CRISPR-associated endonuclease Cas1 [Candidatus Micrarchaeota archaeon]
MILVINDFSTFLGKKGDRFVIKKENKREEFSTNNVEQIIIAAVSSISYGAIRLAIKHSIDVVFLSRGGTPLGRIYPCKLGGTTLTRKKQLEAYYSTVGTNIVKNLVKAKIMNQAYFLKSLEKTRKDINFTSEINSIVNIAKKIPGLTGLIDDIRGTLLGYEGIAANKYFSSLSNILPFKGRDRTSNDYVNIVLNYGYGVLYTEAEKACILAGLDPYFGFLHKDRYNKPSMVLDLVEIFRPIIVDRAVVTLFSQKQINSKCFEKETYGDVFLSKEGREKILSALLSRLNQQIRFKGKKTSFKNIILGESRSIAQYVLGNIPEYEPFVYRW